MSEPTFVGIDVDAKRLVIAHYRDANTQSIDNQPAAIKRWLKQIPADSWIGVESTSSYHQSVVALAQAAGHTVFVLNPRDIRHYARGVGRRGKTDRIDAQIIARYVAKEADHLHPYLPRTPEQQVMHVLQQQRAALQRALAQLRQALTAHGALPQTFKPLMNEARAALKRLDRQIHDHACQGAHADLFRCLISVPGIGPVVAACLVHHLQRWPLTGVNAWIACTGLDPRPNDSGRKIGLRRLSKRGDATLRRMLYMAAMSFARHPLGNALATRYRNRRFTSTATYNILARLIARLAWSLKTTGQGFDPQRFAKEHRIEVAT